MSFRVIDPKPLKLNRSELAVPAARPDMLEKAACSAADVVFIDLEDSVAVAEKDKARAHAIAAINDLDWSNKTLSLRINGLDTAFMYRDVIEVLEQTQDRLDLIMIPKVGNASDVYAVDMLVTQVEQAKGKTKKIGFEIIIETAAGMMNIQEIAAASPRNESLHFGVGDYSASIKARTTSIGGPNPNYAVLTDANADGNRERHWNDIWHYPLSRLVIAARAHGLRAIDGPFTNFQDLQGYEACARSAAILGCEGKWALHPSQITPANDVFVPTQAELDEACGILAAMQQAEREGKAAVMYAGRMIDLASIKQAESLVAFGRAAGMLE